MSTDRDHVAEDLSDLVYAAKVDMKTEEQARTLDRTVDIEGRLLLSDDELDERIDELCNFIETAALVHDQEKCLEEVQNIRRAAFFLKNQSFHTRQQEKLSAILEKCTMLEGDCLHAQNKDAIRQLRAQIAEVDSPKMVDRGKEDPRPEHKRTTKRRNFTEYTQKLLEELTALQGPREGTTGVLEATDAFEDYELKTVACARTTYSALKDHVEEVAQCAGLDVCFLEGGVYKVGMDLTQPIPATEVRRRCCRAVVERGRGEDAGEEEAVEHSDLSLYELNDTPVTRALWLFHHLPAIEELQAHLAAGLHRGWSLLQERSLVSYDLPAVLDGDRLHVSAHPAEEAAVDPVFMTKDALRHSHLRRLMDKYPAVRKVVAESLYPVLGPSANTLPVFTNGSPVALTSHPRHGDIEECDDPWVEVPFPVAKDIAAALGARLPTWREWEAAVRGKGGQVFHTGNEPVLSCLNLDSVEEGWKGTEIFSFGWLRCQPSPGGLVGVARYGYEWNECDYDLKDGLGYIASPATTHVVRSMCDLAVLSDPGRPHATHRTFSFPCAAAYAIPHKMISVAAFRLVFPAPVDRFDVPITRISHPPLSMGHLVMLLWISTSPSVNEGRIIGLLGPPEVVLPGGNALGEWLWPSKGCGIEVNPFSGNRVEAITVYDADPMRPVWKRRFEGTLDAFVCEEDPLVFPVTLATLKEKWKGSAIIEKGSYVYFRRRMEEWRWYRSKQLLGDSTISPDSRFSPSYETVVRVATNEKGRVVSIRLSGGPPGIPVQ